MHGNGNDEAAASNDGNDQGKGDGKPDKVLRRNHEREGPNVRREDDERLDWILKLVSPTQSKFYMSNVTSWHNHQEVTFDWSMRRSY